MGRIRTIKPEFPHSESMGRISRNARLLFIMVWTLVDDSGRARGSSRMLASLLFPYDNDAAEKIPNWLDELVREKCVRLYEVDGGHYLEVCNWLKHQKIDRPGKSRIPAFDEGSTKARDHSRGLDEGSTRARDHSSGDRDLDLGSGTMDLDLGSRTMRLGEDHPRAADAAGSVNGEAEEALVVSPEEKQKPAKAKKPKPVAKPDDVTQETWDDWVAHRKRKSASVTAGVLKSATKRARAEGLTLDTLLAEWTLSGHQGCYVTGPNSDKGKAKAKADQRHTLKGIEYGESGSF